jgi:ribose 5-phosphate isomerase B
MKIALGSDEKTVLTDFIITKLTEAGHAITLHGPLTGVDAYWPSVARGVAEAVAQGDADEGILLCWTGTGVSLAANKIPGIRAALCADAQTARGARLWNNANVLCLSLRLTSQVVAGEILDTWFETSYKPNTVDDACLAEIEALESDYLQSIEK